jgi:hypothetical protein
MIVITKLFCLVQLPFVLKKTVVDAEMTVPGASLVPRHYACVVVAIR